MVVCTNISVLQVVVADNVCVIVSFSLLTALVTSVAGLLSKVVLRTVRARGLFLSPENYQIAG